MIAPRPRRSRRGSRAGRRDRNKPSFLHLDHADPAGGRARTAEIAEKNSSFCTSTTPIPAEGCVRALADIAKTLEFLHLHHPNPRRRSRACRKNRKNLECLHLNHADPRRGSRAYRRNRKKKETGVFAPRPRRSPHRVALPHSRLCPTATPKRKKLLLLSKRGRAGGDMQERMRRRRYAGEDMQELSPTHPLLHVLSSPTYPLLHVLSSPAYHPLCIHPLLYLEPYIYSCVRCSCLSCYVGESSCISSPAYPLLHVFSCISSSRTYPLLHILSCISSSLALHIILSCYAYPLLYLELYTYSCVECSCLSCCAYSLLYLGLRRMQRFYRKTLRQSFREKETCHDNLE